MSCFLKQMINIFVRIHFNGTTVPKFITYCFVVRGNKNAKKNNNLKVN